MIDLTSNCSSSKPSIQNTNQNTELSNTNQSSLAKKQNDEYTYFYEYLDITSDMTCKVTNGK